MKYGKIWTVSMIAGVAFAGSVEAESVDMSAYLMDEKEELNIASTAGPDAITDGATYYVLRQDGFEKAVDGSNGFHCFVERSWTGPRRGTERAFDPEVRAPHCINDEGSRTTMQEIFMVSRLAMSGHSNEEIQREVDTAHADGRLRLPERLSLTYMMSKHQYLAEGIGAWHPHVMIWIPYLTEADVGDIPFGTKNAVLGFPPGTRRTVLIIPVPEFIG